VKLSTKGRYAVMALCDLATHADGRPVAKGNRPDLRPGGATSFMSYDLPWANLSNAPFRLYKHWVHEGGISTPLIVSWPDRVQGPRISYEPCHVIDIMPTLLELAGARYPKENRGRATQPLDGESLVPLFDGRDWTRELPLFWEHEGNSAVRLGHWKLVRRHNQPWELYNLEADRYSAIGWVTAALASPPSRVVTPSSQAASIEGSSISVCRPAATGSMPSSRM